MEHRRLGQSGLKVSVLSLGAMTFGEGGGGFMKGVTSDDAEGRRVFDAALDAGIDTVDTANVYSEGRSEELLGQWLQGKRQRVVLATKCRFPTQGTFDSCGPNAAGLSRLSILRNCEDSLRRLQTDHLDLYQVHMQDRAVPIEETLSALDDLVRQGKVRYTGCSNFTGYRLTEALWKSEARGLERFASLQLQWSLLVRDAERELVPAARHFGLGLMIWSPLARGFLSGKYQRHQPPPAGARLAEWKDTWKGIDTPRSWAVLEAVQAVATARGATPSAVALAWLLARPEASTILVGARTLEQLNQNLAALQVKLTPAEAATLDAASTPAWGYPYDFIGAREPW
jgi:aryl-alcohol dehydrogenase-like predicted oxidoreductase